MAILSSTIHSNCASDYTRAMERLVGVVQELSLAKDLNTITRIVRKAARELTGADGATFVLKEHDQCYYFDEDAIAPLWKGKKFPMSHCISGWVMNHGEHAAIEDIYSDPRIPIDAYRPTFVRSLVMVPIRQSSPIGAIGNYWAKNHQTTEEEVKLLQALADTTSVAMENVQFLGALEQKVRERTAEIEAFSYAVSHDLRAPLRGVKGFALALEEDCGELLNECGRDYLKRIHRSVARMDHLIEDLLRLSKTSAARLNREAVDLTAMAREITAELQSTEPKRKAVFSIAEGMVDQADSHLIRVVLENLLSNAWKFTSQRERTEIAFGCSQTADGATYFVKDNGVGFEEKDAASLCTPFHRLHSESEFPGTGVGLATVQRIIHKHGGRLKVSGEKGKGAVFSFSLGRDFIA